MKYYKRILCALTFLLGLTGLVWADVQFAPGSVIKQFEFPQRDENGKLQSTIYGTEATVITQDRIQIKELKIDIYNGNDNSVGTKVISPESDFLSQERRLTTNHGVTVSQEQFTLTSDNMDWDIKNSNGVFSKNVHVVIFRKEALPGDKSNSEKANKR